MTTIRSLLLGAGFLALLNLANAQQSGEPVQSEIFLPTLYANRPLPSIANAFADIKINDVSLNLTSVTDLQTMLEALQSEPPVPIASLPKNRLNQVSATAFWSLKNPYWPPLPGLIRGESVWPLGNGQFIIDDRLIDYDALQAEADAEAALTEAISPMMRTSMTMSSLSSTYAYGNPVYLTNLVVTTSGGMSAAFDIAGGTNNVPWDIEMATNLVGSWSWQGIGYTANHYTFSNQSSDMALYRLASPSKTMTVGLGDDFVGQCDVPYGLTNILQVAGGAGHSLALKKDGTVVGWGWNPYGQATVPAGLSNVLMVTAGWYHSVALLTNGTLRTWGISDSLLFGGLQITNVPPDLTNVVVVSSQALHTLALRQNGTVAVWGYDGGFGITNIPAGLSNVTAIAAGYSHDLAVSNGYVVAWGNNTYGQCTVPVGLSNVVDVAAGLSHSLALLGNGTVVKGMCRQV
jgi:hypothetical protein